MNEKDIGRKASALAFSIVMVLAIFASVPSAMAASAKTYTLDADFDLGPLVGVEHDTVHDQLQLSKEQTTLPFIWVPNSPMGTVSKVDTVTGKELGRYRVALPGVSGNNGNPSRTTVDLKGNVWVGNREAGTVVKIGLSENGQCVDRNGDGAIETSTDTNNDGDITGAELLDWGKDECVLYEVVLIPGHEGTYVPGTYLGPYDTNYWGTSPRGLAVDKDNNLWAGTSTTKRMFYINGDTGAILKNIDVAGIGGNGAYGAVIDGNGKVWIAVLSTGVRKFDPSTDTITQAISLSHTYGLGLDYEGNLLVGGGGQISKIRTSDGVVLWTKSASASQGITATSDNNIWVASSGAYRYDKDGNWVASIPGFATSITGVAVDAAGKIWGSEMSEFIRRVNPATNTVDLSKRLIDSGYHYTYSDMTGIMARTVTTKIGTWTVDFDSEAADTPWGTVSWTSTEPADTSVKVQARSSNDKLSWSAWEIATNGVKLSATPNGRYLQIETTLQSKSGEESPILKDLTVNVGNQPPVANPGGPYVGNEGSTITFIGSSSSDPDAGDSIVSYEWDLDNDGTFESSGETVTKTWLDDYSGTVTLKVTDTHGATNTVGTTVTVKNVAPTVTITGPATGSVYAVNTPVTFTGTYTDPGTADTHTALWTFDSINTPVQSVTGGSVSTSYTFTVPGIYKVMLTVTDDDLGVGTATTLGGQDAFVVVYDPNGGFVTGGGWIDSQAGAYVPDPALAGRANFGFVSKYQKGATIPTGETEFQFKVGSLNFHSLAYDWLVIAGARAQYKGTGTINGAGDFGFLLTAVDGQINGGGGVDKFRIKITDRTTDTVIYDNAAGSDDLSGSPTQAISGGSIVIHNK